MRVVHNKTFIRAEQSQSIEVEQLQEWNERKCRAAWLQHYHTVM
jgi:hypothetical protein